MDGQPGTRERILDAGCDAIVAKSYNGCGLKEILDSAGVPKGSFYHYFKSKEDFGVAVIQEAVEEHAQEMKAYLTDPSKSPAERVRAFYAACRSCYAGNGAARDCLMAKLALETAQLSEPMREAIKRGYDRWSALLAEAIREAQAAGEVAPGENPERVADFLINTWEGATIRMQINRDVGPLDQFVENVLGRIFTAP